MAEKDSVINMLKFELDNLKKDYKHLVTIHSELKDKRKGNSVAVQTKEVADYNHIAIELAIYSCVVYHIRTNIGEEL